MACVRAELQASLAKDRVSGLEPRDVFANGDNIARKARSSKPARGGKAREAAGQTWADRPASSIGAGHSELDTNSICPCVGTGIFRKTGEGPPVARRIVFPKLECDVHVIFLLNIWDKKIFRSI